MPKVSVVIPTYNRQAMVGEAILSVLHQTYRDFEVIVVDDGSVDDTRNTVPQYSGVRYVYQEHRGVAAARNRGVSEARGELVAFLDSDDLWTRKKLEIQVRFMEENPHAEICQTEEIWVRNGLRVNPRKKHRKPCGDIFAPSLQRCVVSPSAVMMRRALFDAMGGFDSSLSVCEDYDLWLRIAARFPVWLIPAPLVVKRGGHSDQLSRRFWGMDRFRAAALVKLLFSDGLTPHQRRPALEALSTKCAILAAGARKRGREEEAERYLVFSNICGDSTGTTDLRTFHQPS